MSKNRTTSRTRRKEGGSATGTGIFRGRIRFVGEILPARTVVIHKDEEVCRTAGGVTRDVVVYENGGLRSVVLEIQGLDGSFAVPPGGYAVHQKGCKFVLDLFVVADRPEVVVYNDDPVTHNANAGQWNVSQPYGRPLRGTDLDRARRATSDCHLQTGRELIDETG